MKPVNWLMRTLFFSTLIAIIAISISLSISVTSYGHEERHSNSDQKKITFKESMNIFTEKTGKLLNAIVLLNFKEIEKIGLEIKNACNNFDEASLDEYMERTKQVNRRKEFDKMDEDLHEVAEKISQEAQRGSIEGATKLFGQLVNLCVKCHVDFCK